MDKSQGFDEKNILKYLENQSMKPSCDSCFSVTALVPIRTNEKSVGREG